MSEDFLKRLFWACCSEDSFVEDDSLNLGKLYERTEATETALGEISEFAMNFPNLNQNEVGELENLAGAAIRAYEEQGFINGFRMAMKMILGIN